LLLPDRSKTCDPSFCKGTEEVAAPQGHPSPSLGKRATSYRKAFGDLAERDVLLGCFSCAWQREVPYHGRLYVSSRHLCFHSSLLLKDIKAVVPVASISALKKTNTALLVPNALSIRTAEGEKFLFVSLRRREATYQLLKSVCKHLKDKSWSPPDSPNTKEILRKSLTSSQSDLEQSTQGTDGLQELPDGPSPTPRPAEEDEEAAVALISGEGVPSAKPRSPQGQELEPSGLSKHQGNPSEVPGKVGKWLAGGVPCVPDRGRAWNWMIFKVLPTQTIPQFHDFGRGRRGPGPLGWDVVAALLPGPWEGFLGGIRRIDESSSWAGVDPRTLRGWHESHWVPLVSPWPWGGCLGGRAPLLGLVFFQTSSQSDLEQSTQGTDGLQELPDGPSPTPRPAEEDEEAAVALISGEGVPSAKPRSPQGGPHTALWVRSIVPLSPLSTVILIYLLLMVALLLSSGYIGLRIVALEQRLASVGAWPELNLSHQYNTT
ncbi:PREDICTED: uncharacterized protein LOC106892090, partial [Calidris pugnax]|uniref:uncharacterized protein LOC106892090 n=1 Tax=Calidris pugnax TaxID=198806 RepID=UPI00071CE172